MGYQDKTILLGTSKTESSIYILKVWRAKVTKVPRNVRQVCSYIETT